MNFYIISIFPESFRSYLDSSILKRAQKRGLISIKIINPRKFTKDRYKTVDDKSYGGGPGMVIKAEPILKATHQLIGESVNRKKFKIILLSAKGRQFDQKLATKWAKLKNIVFISGRYEGIDERVKKILRAEEVSIGPYVLSGGELPSMVLVEAIARHIRGVLGKNESLEEKRYGSGIPVYTRPEVFEYKGKKYRAPKVLLSGNHKKIEVWRKKHKK